MEVMIAYPLVLPDAPLSLDAMEAAVQVPDLPRRTGAPRRGEATPHRDALRCGLAAAGAHAAWDAGGISNPMICRSRRRSVAGTARPRCGSWRR